MYAFKVFLKIWETCKLEKSHKKLSKRKQSALFSKSSFPVWYQTPLDQFGLELSSIWDHWCRSESQTTERNGRLCSLGAT